MISHIDGDCIAFADPFVDKKPGDFVGTLMEDAIGEDVITVLAVFKNVDLLVRRFIRPDFDQMGGDYLIKMSF